MYKRTEINSNFYKLIYYLQKSRWHQYIAMVTSAVIDEVHTERGAKFPVTHSFGCQEFLFVESDQLILKEGYCPDRYQ